MSALSGLHLAELTVKNYQKMRSDEKTIFQKRLKERSRLSFHQQGCVTRK